MLVINLFVLLPVICCAATSSSVVEEQRTNLTHEEKQGALITALHRDLKMTQKALLALTEELADAKAAINELNIVSTINAMELNRTARYEIPIGGIISWVPWPERSSLTEPSTYPKNFQVCDGSRIRKGR